MSEIDRRVVLKSVLNMRDLGGLPVAGGTMRSGQVYRSASLANLSDADKPAFEQRNITTIFDLRTAGEASGAPDVVPNGARSFGLDVLADSPAAAAGNINEMLANPALLADALGGGKAAEMLTESYRDIVGLPSALSAYRSFFLSLADPNRGGAALFHCTTGKDRTGWAAAALLTLLGATKETVLADYLQTNTDLVPALQPLIDRAAAGGIDTELILPVLGVDESYLAAAFDEVTKRFGDMDGYFTRGLGLNPEHIAAIRAQFVA